MEVRLYSDLCEIVHLTVNLIPLCLLTRAECGIPWAPEVFLAYGGNFRCWPKADTSSVVGRSHTETGTAREKSLAPKVNAGKVYRRSNNVSKQSHSAIRHDTDDCEVA